MKQVKKLVLVLMTIGLFALQNATASSAPLATFRIHNVTKQKRIVFVNGTSHTVDPESYSNPIQTNSGLATISAKPSLDPSKTGFEPYSDWVITVSEFRVYVDPALSKPIFGVRATTNRAVGLEVWIDDVNVGTVKQVGERVLLSPPRMPDAGQTTSVQIRKIGSKGSLATTSLVSAGPLTSYSVTIVPAPEGFKILLEIESAAVGAPITDPIHTDGAVDNPSGLPRTLTFGTISSPGRVIPWADLRAVGTGSSKLPDDAIGWWTKSRRIGDIGISIFVGHVGFRDGRPGVFGSLKGLTKGEIQVLDSVGKLRRYTIYRHEQVAKKPYLPPSFFEQVTTSEIRLITCDDSGPSEIINGEFHWVRNIVVFARLSG